MDVHRKSLEELAVADGTVIAVTVSDSGEMVHAAATAEALSSPKLIDVYVATAGGPITAGISHCKYT